MRKTLSESEFLELKKYIVSNSVNPNADRCCVFFKDNIDITMCFDDATLTACICASCISEQDDPDDVFEYLIGLSKTAEINQKRYEFYEAFLKENWVECECLESE
jgi:hypothetical protein